MRSCSDFRDGSESGEIYCRTQPSGILWATCTNSTLSSARAALGFKCNQKWAGNFSHPLHSLPGLSCQKGNHALGSLVQLASQWPCQGPGSYIGKDQLSSTRVSPGKTRDGQQCGGVSRVRCHCSVLHLSALCRIMQKKIKQILNLNVTNTIIRFFAT